MYKNKRRLHTLRNGLLVPALAHCEAVRESENGPARPATLSHVLLLVMYAWAKPAERPMNPPHSVLATRLALPPARARAGAGPKKDGRQRRWPHVRTHARTEAVEGGHREDRVHDHGAVIVRVKARDDLIHGDALVGTLKVPWRSIRTGI